MDNTQRAKQFLAFSALSGFDTSVRVAEMTADPRVIPAEDAQNELNSKLQSIAKSDIISVRCYRLGHYVNVSGTVTNISPQEHCLFIDGSRIPFRDILDIWDGDEQWI